MGVVAVRIPPLCEEGDLVSTSVLRSKETGVIHLGFLSVVCLDLMKKTNPSRLDGTGGTGALGKGKNESVKFHNICRWNPNNVLRSQTVTKGWSTTKFKLSGSVS